MPKESQIVTGERTAARAHEFWESVNDYPEFHEEEDQPRYNLSDEGRSDGMGESYAERNA